MKKLGILMVLISCCTVALTRPRTERLKRKFPPPDAGFVTRDTPTNLTIDELITQQMNGSQGTASRVMDEGGSILTELDLLLTPEQFAAFHPHESDILPNHTDGSRKKRKAERNTKLRWTRAEIPYSFDSNTFDSNEQFMIREAMSEWERYTCLKFTPATASQTNVLFFLGGTVGCMSQLGMIGGTQSLYLQKPGCRYRGLYLHEIGHAIGLIHEQQRPDRENYIDIIMQNVAPALRAQFTKYTLDKVDLVNTIYEYSSVMHYGITAFSYNGKAQTMRAKDPAREEEIGKVYLKELSFMDVKAVNNMYNCSAHCGNSVKCSDAGYVDQNCRCVCRDGSRDCEVGYEKPQTNGDCSNEYDDWQCSIWANHGQCRRNQQFMSKSCKKACHLCATAAPNGECSDVFPAQKCGKWKERGDCIANEWWMSQNCRKTCNACVSKDQRPETKCDNKHSDTAKCEQWAISGECQVNRNWMLNNCQSACQYCHKTPPVGTGTTGTGDCVDIYFNKKACSKWAESGECEANPVWMADNCRKSCGKCGGGMVTEKTGPCVDSDSRCPGWADEGACLVNPLWMKDNCPLSCLVCTPGTGPTQSPGTRPTVKPNVPCSNLHNSEQECEIWADNGHCDINPSFMHKNCRKACRLCKDVTDESGVCEDIYEDKARCEQWAAGGECQANPTWMMVNCKKSCGECKPVKPGVCVDKYEDKSSCARWAASGECLANPGWMLDNCRKSCNQCNADIPGTNGGNRLGAFNKLILAVVHIVVTLVARWM